MYVHNLEEIFRENMVHYKSRTMPLVTGINPFLRFDDAERAVNTVPLLVNALKSIDPQIDASWLTDDMIYRIELDQRG